ncbi:MAG: hypothetical protein QGG36_31065 [Pirellulaceae bacterium]|nr:hypothetical protein [Pirellulaceae bacterium]MDP7020279.1 hypothetical protein [Pirellulaceae bacterium]
MESIHRDYAPQGVKFFYIYKHLQHPGYDGYVQPVSLAERLKHVAEAQRRLDTKIGWIVDAMDNQLKHALGNQPNSEFVVDPAGKIVRTRSWSDPTKLRKDLAELVGPVENPTTTADLNRKWTPVVEVAQRGVLNRIDRREMKLGPVLIKPEESDGSQPFYVKLRAEADKYVVYRGSGKLYLGFHLDPIYRVHWNNLTKPLRIEVESPDGTTLTLLKRNSPTDDKDPADTAIDEAKADSQRLLAEAVQVKAESDADPREFLFEVKGDKTDKPIRVTVSYFACNDEEGWCKAIEQSWLVSLRRDPDAGSASQGRSRGPRGQRPRKRTR